MKDLFQMDCDNLKWEGAYDDDDDDGADLKDFIVDDDDESWIELNWTNIYSVLRQHPVQYHTHIATTTKMHLSHDIIYILYYFGSRKIFFRMKQSIGKQRSHIHIQTGVYNEWCNAAAPVRNIHTIILVGKSKFFTFNILHNALTSSLVAISMSIQ